MSTVAIIVAAGQGLRAGGEIPKQFQRLCGKCVVEWSIDTFLRSPSIDETILVLSPDAIGPFREQYANTPLKVILGGATRTESIKAGLAAINVTTDPIVLLHDAARPGIDEACITQLIKALSDADAAAPALIVSDALKRQTNTGLSSVDRSNLFRVQTPQAFRLSTIKAAHAVNASDLVDDLAAVESTGAKVTLIPGDERYNKITYQKDFQTMSSLLGTVKLPRIGKGYDVHALGPGSDVTMCGVEIPHDGALIGHSDADVAWHALTDAILGALALGDIGDHFPPSDDKWKGADSAVFLKAAIEMVHTRGFIIGNCDLTIICEAPKVKPHREAMRKRTADITEISVDCVSVKATTTEKLGFTGRGEGIAAEAIVMLLPA
jgi:2-C-methyl-D-erythritol 4-phosphate cytidylyltransferase/2-C-methyl-D-erythritol 2,4-cyclodiphosphate synthase